MGAHVLAFDAGTSSVRSVIYDEELCEVASAQRTVPCSFPHAGWVDQDANLIWQQQLATVHSALERANLKPSDIDAIGITNQRETTILWDRDTGEPLAPAIVWQCRRTSDRCEEMRTAKQDKWIQDRTGLVVDPYFSATKLAWLLEHVPDTRQRVKQGGLAFGTVDSWLIYKLTAGKVHVIDRTNASRTMLMKLANDQWDPDLLSFFDIDESLLPKIVGSAGVVGHTDPEIFGSSVPIAGIAGDQQSALFGQGCTEPGQVKVTYGTGCFILQEVGQSMPTSMHNLLTTASASSTQTFALEGSVFDAGTVIQWMRDNLRLFDDAKKTSAIAESVDDSGGVTMIPAFSGLGAPHWRAELQGSIHGITRGTSGAQIVRAGIESIAFQVADLVEAICADSGIEFPALAVDGGASANNFLMQFQADITQKEVHRPQDIETTARGAAMLASLGSGIHHDLTPPILAKLFEPKMKVAEAKERRYRWQEVLSRELN